MFRVGANIRVGRETGNTGVFFWPNAYFQYIKILFLNYIFCI